MVANGLFVFGTVLYVTIIYEIAATKAKKKTTNKQQKHGMYLKQTKTRFAFEATKQPLEWMSNWCCVRIGLDLIWSEP